MRCSRFAHLHQENKPVVLIEPSTRKTRYPASPPIDRLAVRAHEMFAGAECDSPSLPVRSAAALAELLCATDNLGRVHNVGIASSIQAIQQLIDLAVPQIHSDGTAQRKPLATLVVHDA
jgi:hypothetical protein